MRLDKLMKRILAYISWMMVMVIFINQKQIETPTGSAATEGSGSFLCCYASGQCLGLISAYPMSLCTPTPSWYKLHPWPFVTGPHSFL